MEDQHLRFFSAPYFLRLHLPRSVEETDAAEVVWSADDMSFKVKAPKKIAGEHFPGLDMLTSLLAPERPEGEPV